MTLKVACVAKIPPGWYLGLRYMQGSGLVARVAEKMDATKRGAHFIFADRVLACPDRRLAHDPRRLVGFAGRKQVASFWLGYRIADITICCRAKRVSRLNDAARMRWIIGPAGNCMSADLIDGYAYIVWRKRGDEAQLITPWRKQKKHLLIARTGAHGDALMASSILPRLKQQGWAISFITRQAGCDVLRCDPHIDELILLAAGQVSDEELPYYWQAWQKRFDRFINLTHSIEGELLKQPPRADYWWPDDQRRAHCGRSYLGYLHHLAGVPGPYRVRFYPDTREKFRARKQARKLGPFVLWCLRGSAVHKWWPYGPEAICQLLAKTKFDFVLAGDSEGRAAGRMRFSKRPENIAAIRTACTSLRRQPFDPRDHGAGTSRSGGSWT